MKDLVLDPVAPAADAPAAAPVLPLACADARAFAAEYAAFCARFGFHAEVDAEALLDPALDPVPTLSPLFDPALYARLAGLPQGAGINPYLHYFRLGWRRGPAISRLVERGFLRAAGWSPEPGVPLLIALVRAAGSEDAFTPHPLFEPALWRRHAPRRATPAFVEFLRRRTRAPFSRYVDPEMLDRATAGLDARGRNPLERLVAAPVGADANPTLFGAWYAERHGRSRAGDTAERDMLTDYVLIGAGKGWMANPYARRDLGLGAAGPAAPPPATRLLEHVAVKHIARWLA